MNNRSASPLGVGIIGCGNVMDAYLRLAEHLERLGLARVACGREAHRQRVLSRLPDATFYTDSQALDEE
jgi:predicted dehydrogenase